MCSSYSLSRCFVFVYIIAMQVFLVHRVSSMNLTNAYLHHKCLISQKNYKPGSEYEKNLNSLIRLLSPYHFSDGFRHTTYGEAPNSVTLIFQCRGDSYGSNCRSCFATAVAGLRRRCPRNKGAIIWYDQCFLDVGTIDSSPREMDYDKTFSMYNPKNVNGDKESFNKKMSEFLYKLMSKADRPSPNSSEFIYYASGEEMLGTKKLYAMVQCAKDIAFCEVCLKWSIKELSKCCLGKQGARVLGTSCNLRYELYPFLRS